MDLMRASRPALQLFAVAMTALSLLALVWTPFQRDGSTAAASSSPDDSPIKVVKVTDDVRVVRHPGGVTRVPRDPDRICALQFADEVVALGRTPTAVPANWHGRKADYLRKELASAAPIPHTVGAWMPSFETIAMHEPDVILTWIADWHTYEQLSRIAPTIVVRPFGQALDENSDIDALKTRLRDVGLVLGLEAEADAAIARFEAKARRARGLLRERMAGKTIAFIRARGREWRLYGRRGGCCGGEAIYNALQLKAPEMAAGRGTNLTPAKLVSFDADYLLVVADSILASGNALARLRRNPLWQRVTAVRNGNVLSMEAFDHWVLSGLAGKSKMIDDVLACVREGEAR